MQFSNKSLEALHKQLLKQSVQSNVVKSQTSQVQKSGEHKVSVKKTIEVSNKINIIKKSSEIQIKEEKQAIKEVTSKVAAQIRSSSTKASKKQNKIPFIKDKYKQCKGSPSSSRKQSPMNSQQNKEALDQLDSVKSFDIQKKSDFFALKDNATFGNQQQLKEQFIIPPILPNYSISPKFHDDYNSAPGSKKLTNQEKQVLKMNNSQKQLCKFGLQASTKQFLPAQMSSRDFIAENIHTIQNSRQEANNLLQQQAQYQSYLTKQQISEKYLKIVQTLEKLRFKTISNGVIAIESQALFTDDASLNLLENRIGKINLKNLLDLYAKNFAQGQRDKKSFEILHNFLKIVKSIQNYENIFFNQQQISIYIKKQLKNRQRLSFTDFIEILFAISKNFQETNDNTNSYSNFNLFHEETFSNAIFIPTPIAIRSCESIDNNNPLSNPIDNALIVMLLYQMDDLLNYIFQQYSLQNMKLDAQNCMTQANVLRFCKDFFIIPNLCKQSQIISLFSSFAQKKSQIIYFDELVLILCCVAHIVIRLDETEQQDQFFKKMSKLFEILLSANEKNFEEFMNKRFSRMRT